MVINTNLKDSPKHKVKKDIESLNSISFKKIKKYFLVYFLSSNTVETAGVVQP